MTFMTDDGCVAAGSNSATEIIDALLAKVVDVERSLGVTVEIERHLPSGKSDFTAREIVNAIGLGLTEVGVPNNLYKERAE